MSVGPGRRPAHSGGLRWLLAASMLLGLALLHGVAHCGGLPTSTPHHDSGATRIAQAAPLAAGIAAITDAAADQGHEPGGGDPASAASACLYLLAAVIGLAVVLRVGRLWLLRPQRRPARRRLTPAPTGGPLLARLCVLRT